MKKKSICLISSLLLSAGISLSVGAGITYANYKTAALVTQHTGYQGKLNQVSIFFNANIWEVDSPSFYMYAAADGSNWNWISPSRIINPTINNVTFTLYVFVIENAVSGTTKFEFARLNPKYNGVLPHWDAKWNQTGDITYSSSTNYYCIEGWKYGDGTDSYAVGANLALDGSGHLYFT